MNIGRDYYIYQIKTASSLRELVEVLVKINTAIDWDLFESSAASGAISKEDFFEVGLAVETLLDSSPDISLFGRGLLTHLASQLKKGDITTIRATVSQLLSFELYDRSA